MPASCASLLAAVSPAQSSAVCSTSGGAKQTTKLTAVVAAVDEAVSPAACSSFRAAVDAAERTTKHTAVGQTLVTAAHVSVRAAISPTLDAADSAAYTPTQHVFYRPAVDAAKRTA